MRCLALVALVAACGGGGGKGGGGLSAEQVKGLLKGAKAIPNANPDDMAAMTIELLGETVFDDPACAKLFTGYHNTNPAERQRAAQDAVTKCGIPMGATADETMLDGAMSIALSRVGMTSGQEAKDADAALTALLPLLRKKPAPPPVDAAVPAPPPPVDAAPPADAAANEGPKGRISVASKTLSDAALSKVMSMYMNGLRRCYREALKKDAAQRGSLKLELTINDRGRVESPHAQFADAELASCAVGQMSSWTFPKNQATTTPAELVLMLVPD